jgi:hypothetical protein
MVLFRQLRNPNAIIVINEFSEVVVQLFGSVIGVDEPV